CGETAATLREAGTARRKQATGFLLQSLLWSLLSLLRKRCSLRRRQEYARVDSCGDHTLRYPKPARAAPRLAGVQSRSSLPRVHTRLLKIPSVVKKGRAPRQRKRVRTHI